MKFYIHRRREGYTWFLKSSEGNLLAVSAKYFTERKTAVMAIHGLKHTIADAEIAKA